ncbi:type IV pilin N-terminal domain-containing protein [Haloarcula montana]|uniref:type IV pilin N-terminal domain-containing protein n=1 Tax=Haloarcula montana TaxID=3111776 RepID=UPI002D78D3DB|nr:type IV pilin N-terminal domain-containing protein [Haloarcula sp. GH36]
MDLKQLFNDDDAVSPVIGVILMVAITVILAAVIASFVLGLGDQTQSATPQASFSFDYESGTSLSVTHDGGDTINANELYIRGQLDTSTTNVDLQWSDFGSAGTEVTAGQGITIDGSASNPSAAVAPDGTYDIRVVYESAEGDSSATLGQDSGPEA